VVQARRELEPEQLVVHIIPMRRRHLRSVLKIEAQVYARPWSLSLFVSEMAMRLQRAVLPDALPEREGWEMIAHYSPAGQLEVGGDFYDVLPLDDDRFALFIGDVMGRGVHASAAMAHVRSATRALVAVDPAPTAVLTRMDQVFDRYELAQLVTMLYAVVDQARDELTIANAGHLAPVVIRADGAVELLSLPEGLLLGAGGSTRTCATYPFGPGDTLLVFTDGLIERRGEDIDAGQERLLRACAALRSGSLAETLGDVVREVSDPVRDDDVAAVVLRRAPVAVADDDAVPAVREPARAF